MSRRKVKKSMIQGYDPSHYEGLMSALYPEVALYPDGRPNIKQIRELERMQTQRLRETHVRLPNPTESAPIDRMRRLDRRSENEALGLQSQPDRLIDLPPGDSGAGQTMFRRTQVFARLDAPANSTVAGNPLNRAIGLATQRSSDCRPRFWHISFFGIGVQRVVNAVPTQPLTQDEILSQQFDPVVTGAVATPRFVPAITTMQGRIMVFDESGQRFYDVDILGNRSLDVYAWGVTVFILLPDNFGSDQQPYEVNRGSGGDLPQRSLEGLVEDSIVAARVVPIAINSTQNEEQRTITAITNETDVTRVPIPPGTRKVQIISQEPSAIATSYLIQFDAGDDGTFAGTSTLGIIDINAGESKSDVILVPNAAQIIFTPTLATPAGTYGWSLIFTVESQ